MLSRASGYAVQHGCRRAVWRAAEGRWAAVRIPARVRPHIDEAAYLYGLSRGLAERAGVTWFLLRKKTAQLADRIGRRSPDGRDASIDLYGSRHTVDLLGSEIYVLDEIYRERLYDRLDDFVPSAG